MQAERILPRWSVLRKIGRLVGLGCFLYAMAVGFFYRMAMEGNQTAPAAYWAFSWPSLEQLSLLGIFVLITIGLFSLLRDATLPLLNGEQYLILVLIAVSLSIWFGAANYLIYARNADAFAVDKDLAEKLRSTQEAQWQEKLIEARQTIAGCERVLRALRTEPDAELRATQLGVDGYRIVLKSAPVTIDISLGPDPLEDGHFPTAVFRVVATLNGDRIAVDRFQGFLAQRGVSRWSSLGPRLYNASVAPKAALMQIFEDESRWQVNNWLSPMQKPISRRAAPLSLFLYQSAMDTLGASPKYFTPVAFTAKAIALLYAFLKLIFFGMVISTVAKQLAIQRSNKAGPASA